METTDNHLTIKREHRGITGKAVPHNCPHCGNSVMQTFMIPQSADTKYLSLCGSCIILLDNKY